MWASKESKTAILALSCLVLISLTGCSLNRAIVVNVIDKEDYFAVKQGTTYTADREGFFLSKRGMTDLFDARVQQKANR